MIKSKTTGEQTAKGLKPIRQTAHGDSCERIKVWTKSHKPQKRFLAFYTFLNSDQRKRGFLLLLNLIWKKRGCLTLLCKYSVCSILFFHLSAAGVTNIISAIQWFTMYARTISGRGVRCRSKIKKYASICFLLSWGSIS